MEEAAELGNYLPLSSKSPIEGAGHRLNWPFNQASY